MNRARYCLTAPSGGLVALVHLPVPSTATSKQMHLSSTKHFARRESKPSISKRTSQYIMELRNINMFMAGVLAWPDATQYAMNSICHFPE